VVQEPSSPADIAFTRQRIAVFIDGCFWHSCPDHLHLPKANADYWVAKLARTVERDAEVSALLRDLGWTVLRFWEHQPPEEAAAAIIDAVQARREGVITRVRVEIRWGESAGWKGVLGRASHERSASHDRDRCDPRARHPGRGRRRSLLLGLG
jgi:DNA mismatch endonuclease (patch repair protein)